MIYTFEIDISNCSRQTTMLVAFKFYFFPHTYIYRASLQLCVWHLFLAMVLITTVRDWALQFCVISTVSPISSSGAPWVLSPYGYLTARFRLLLVEPLEQLCCLVWTGWTQKHRDKYKPSVIAAASSLRSFFFLFAINLHCVFVCYFQCFFSNYFSVCL